MYHYDSLEQEDKLWFFKSKDDVTFIIKEGENRRFVSILVEVSTNRCNLTANFCFLGEKLLDKKGEQNGNIFA